MIRCVSLGIFSGGPHEVSIAAISLIGMAEKSGHIEAEISRLIKTEKSGPNRWHKNRAKHVNRNHFNSDNWKFEAFSSRIKPSSQHAKDHRKKFKTLTLFDMGFFWTVSHWRAMRASDHNFVVIAPMVIKFGTGVKLDVFYTMVTKNLWRHYYYVIMTS